MLAARGKTADGGALIVLGLEPENIRRIQAGQPIRLTPSSNPVLQGLRVEIVITTAEELAQQMGKGDES